MIFDLERKWNVFQKFYFPQVPGVFKSKYCLTIERNHVTIKTSTILFSFSSPSISMFLGLCDFAKMHHQQRMAALGTDKELSDLLDFSAVRKNGGN